jgi:hypothetical protein
VPVFDLRPGSGFKSEDIPKIFDYSLWPQREPHYGSVVLVGWTLGQYRSPQTQYAARLNINTNLLWVGVLHGDPEHDK